MWPKFQPVWQELKGTQIAAENLVGQCALLRCLPNDHGSDESLDNKGLDTECDSEYEVCVMDEAKKQTFVPSWV